MKTWNKKGQGQFVYQSCVRSLNKGIKTESSFLTKIPFDEGKNTSAKNIPVHPLLFIGRLASVSPRHDLGSETSVNKDYFPGHSRDGGDEEAQIRESL